MIYATTWPNLKIIVLSERSQKQNSTYCKIPSLQTSRRGETDYSGRAGRASLTLGVEMSLQVHTSDAVLHT